MSEVNKAMTATEAKKLDTYLSNVYSINDIFIDMHGLIELFVNKATLGTPTSTEQRDKVIKDNMEFLADLSEKQPDRVADILETIHAMVQLPEEEDRYYGLVLLFRYCNDERYKKDIIKKLKGQTNSKYGMVNTKA